MPRLAVFNMFFGFLVLFVAAAAGSFVAVALTRGYITDKALLSSWAIALEQSAHGHANLFGLVHVLFGLTLPYSPLPFKIKRLQTIGLVLGTLAMGIGLLVRAAYAPSAPVDVLEVIIGLFLSCALLALASHAYGLAAKMLGRG